MSSLPSGCGLLQAALEFRGAIERSDSLREDPEFRTFPKGSCKSTSLLFARFLRERWSVDWQLVSAQRGRPSKGNWVSHAWLESGGIIFDLTADQFPDAPSPVIVSSESEWHRRFVWKRKFPVNDYGYHGEALVKLERQYGHVRTQLGAV